ncbi:hypothetical protein QUC31_014895 [Theobroma cacao]
MSLDTHTKLLLVLSLFCFNVVFAGESGARSADLGMEGFEQHGRGLGLSHYKGRSSHLFNVKSFGARADGLTDDSKAFRAAWKKACQATGEVDLVIPRGTYLVGPVKFAGPCTNVSKITVRVKGYLKATTNLSKYGHSAGWVEFKWVEGLILTGGGTFDGQGAKAWPYNRCPTDFNCKLLPTNVKFVGTNRTVVRSITSVNSKFFHMALVECKNFKGSKIKISAPADSPNTDGIHIERSSSVHFSRSLIGTGDDCISIGQGNSQVTITSISCGPGHGIRYSFNFLITCCCTLFLLSLTIGTSQVKLSDIYFKKIKGTSSSAVAVTLECSKGIPCQDIYLEDVHLDLASGEKQATSTCKNVRAKYIGTQIPPPCA